MANEITYNIFFEVEKGGAKFTRATGSQNITVSGDHIAAGTQNVGTSAEALEKGGITTTGMLYIHNLDGTNFVEVGYDDTGFKPTVKVKAGEYAAFRLTQSTPQVKADTAAVNIEYILVED